MTQDPKPLWRDERGQMFSGYIVGILILMGLAVTMIRQITVMRRSAEKNFYREQAIQVARAGFDEAVAYFRSSVGGVYLKVGDTPVNTTVTGVDWRLWPDAAFMPLSPNVDSAIFSQILTPTGSTDSSTYSAKAMVRTYPLASYSSLTSNPQSSIWGRYVVKRQNSRNWSPVANTAAASTDPDAVHDLTHVRSTGAPGSGNYWAITSQGYVFANSTGYPPAAAFDNNDLLRAPRGTYNKKRQLLAKAQVYGEIFRMNFFPPDSAIFVSAAASLSVGAKGSVIGGTGKVFQYSTGAFKSVTAGGTTSGTMPTAVIPGGRLPIVSSVLPGLDRDRLRNLAISIDASKVGSTAVMPYEPVGSSDSNEFTNRVSRISFYFIEGDATFLALSRTVMTGVGLVYVDGNLTIEARNNSTWAGIVIVKGNVSIRGPGYISGTLISNGKVTIGGNASDVSPALVEYSSEAWETVSSFLDHFHVIDSSVVVNKF